MNISEMPFKIIPQDELNPPPYMWRYLISTEVGNRYWSYTRELYADTNATAIEYRPSNADSWLNAVPTRKDGLIQYVTVSLPSGSTVMLHPDKTPLGSVFKMQYQAIGGIVHDTMDNFRTHRKSRGIGHTRNASSKRKKK